jgi:SAM-dependent methyltransferase
VETAKSKHRRLREGWFGNYAPEGLIGIDIGCGRDPLNQSFRRWDFIYGDSDATEMAGVPRDLFHTVYASHVLEHLNDPVRALRRWLRILRPGGHLIVCVPHRELYEKRRVLPSRWNPDHKWFYLPDDVEPPHTRSFKDTLFEAMDACDELVLFRVLDEGWRSRGTNHHSEGEYSIEGIVKKSGK